MKLSVVQYEERDSVAIIAMSHPPVNALGVEFLGDFERVLEHLGTADVRAVVLTSTCPGFFSAGDDIGALRELDASLLDKLPRAHAVLDAFETLALPTVAAINGQALGGGLELAMVCDFRFMGDASGRIGLPEVRLGMIPALGGTQRLAEIVGRGVAIEMMFKGLQLLPEDAKRVGLIHDVFAQTEIVDRSIDYATRLGRQATAAIARIKHCMHVGRNEGRAAGMAAERAAFRDNITSPDAREGVAAFLGGRKPAFTGES